MPANRGFYDKYCIDARAVSLQFVKNPASCRCHQPKAEQCSRFLVVNRVIIIDCTNTRLGGDVPLSLLPQAVKSESDPCLVLGDASEPLFDVGLVDRH